MWVCVLMENVMKAPKALAVSTRDRQCVLYTYATRALYRTRADLLAQVCREVKGAVRAKKRGGKLEAPPPGPAGKNLKMLWPPWRQNTGDVGFKRAVSGYVGSGGCQSSGIAAAVGRYVPKEMITRRKQPEEDGGAP